MRVIAPSALPAALLVVLAALGCSPHLNSADGYYGCSESGECPSIAPFCRADGRCHASPADDGGSDDAGPGDDAGPPPDGGPPPPDGGPPPPDGGPPPCSTSTECLMGGLCIDGGCRRGCTVDGDCPPGAECVGATSAGTHANVCLTATDARRSPYYSSCAGGCPAPFECIEDHCMRSCEGGTTCFEDEVCTMSPPPSMGGEMRAVCVELCADSTCPTGGRCAPPPPPGGATNVCLVW